MQDKVKNKYKPYREQFGLIKKHIPTTVTAKILDASCGKGQLMLLFHGANYQEIYGVDRKTDETIKPLLFRDYLFLKNKVLEKGKRYYIANKPLKKYKLIADLLKEVSIKALEPRFNKNIHISTMDFLDFPKFFHDCKQFNVLVASYVLHLYPQEKDALLLQKIKDLLLDDGVVYIKVFNLNRAVTYLQKQANKEAVTYNETNHTLQNTFGDKTYTWHLFSAKRLQYYCQDFTVLYQNDSEDFSELILQKKETKTAEI